MQVSTGGGLTVKNQNCPYELVKVFLFLSRERGACQCTAKGKYD